MRLSNTASFFCTSTCLDMKGLASICKDFQTRLVSAAGISGSALSRWILLLGHSVPPPPIPSLCLTLFPVIFSDQWRRKKNQWSKVITWRKIQRRPEARPATWVPFHASAAATQTHSTSLYSHLKQHEQPEALYPMWPIPPQRKLPDCTTVHCHCLPNSCAIDPQSHALGPWQH